MMHFSPDALMAGHYPRAQETDSLWDMPQLDPAPRMRSRMAKGQQWAGNQHRIAKPWSANNSPRSSMLASRRGSRLRAWTAATGPSELPTPPLGMDTAFLPSWDLNPNMVRDTLYEPYVPPEVKPVRPVSWHPSSHQGQQLAWSHQHNSGSSTAAEGPPPAYTMPTSLVPLSSPLDMLSGYTSPPEACSPLALPAPSLSWTPPSQPLSTLEQYEPPTAVFHAVPDTTNHDMAPMETASAAAYYATPSGYLQPTSRQSAPFAPQRPSPEPFVPQSVDISRQNSMNLVSPVVHEQQQQQQESLPPADRQEQQQQQQQQQPASADDDDDGSEILYGLGLHDPPSQHTDSILRNEIASFKTMPPGMRRPGWLSRGTSGGGLGLKLEEAWTPPESDGEEEGEEEDDGKEGKEQGGTDGEGEKDE
ncbi:hypothetical protein VTK26DRAFT_5811 [Humicola hyalothermophila]